MRAVRCLFPPLVAIAVAACASTSAPPRDLSAAQHDAMAASEERAAMLELNEARVARDAMSARCSNPPLPGNDMGACWSSLTRPTEQHTLEAAAHKKRAAEHRAASESLRNAEARACVGLSAHDRDTSPFSHTEDILRVDAYAPSGQLEGAVVTFRAVPGMSAAWLQRVVDCHLARNEAMGHVVPDMPSCPLVPPDVAANVTEAEEGIMVTVRAADPQTAREVLRRAQLSLPK